MKSLTINIPEGFVMDKFDEKTGEVTFKNAPKEIKERIKTFEDVLKYHNITQESFDLECDALDPDEIAYKKIKLIAKALNEGWTPDWSNSNEYKYTPYFKMGSPSGGGFSYDGYVHWFTYSHVGSRLCFKSSELAKYAGTQFEDIYKEFLTINK